MKRISYNSRKISFDYIHPVFQECFFYIFLFNYSSKIFGVLRLNIIRLFWLEVNWSHDPVRNICWNKNVKKRFHDTFAIHLCKQVLKSTSWERENLCCPIWEVFFKVPSLLLYCNVVVLYNSGGISNGAVVSIASVMRNQLCSRQHQLITPAIKRKTGLDFCTGFLSSLKPSFIFICSATSSHFFFTTNTSLL